mmetsp:Transcript_39585/g.63510  ORF Transcript_39585/g.63510 Transcript_39585/m.63510 type:complete len:203 (+) Transcript_39585:711-1319(+)
MIIILVISSSSSSSSISAASSSSSSPSISLSAPPSLTSWHVFNDSSVSPSTLGILENITTSFPNDVAYALFYRRIDDDDDGSDDDGDEEKRNGTKKGEGGRAAGVPAPIVRMVARDNTAYKAEMSRLRAYQASAAAVSGSRSNYASAAVLHGGGGGSALRDFNRGGLMGAPELFDKSRERVTQGYSDAKMHDGTEYVDPDFE